MNSSYFRLPALAGCKATDEVPRALSHANEEKMKTGPRVAGSENLISVATRDLSDRMFRTQRSFYLPSERITGAISRKRAA